MNKAEFISAIANGTGYTNAVTKETIDTMIEVITKTLKKGDKISLVGFGSIFVAEIKQLAQFHSQQNFLLES